MVERLFGTTEAVSYLADRPPAGALLLKAVSTAGRTGDVRRTTMEKRTFFPWDFVKLHGISWELPSGKLT